MQWQYSYISTILIAGLINNLYLIQIKLSPHMTHLDTKEINFKLCVKKEYQQDAKI